MEPSEANDADNPRPADVSAALKASIELTLPAATTLLIVIASYYGLFAVMSGSVHALIMESAIIALFVLASVLGFKFSLWLVVGALFAHGILDFIHHHVVQNPGVPAWWPMFCLTYDCTAAAYLAWLLLRPKIKMA